MIILLPVKKRRLLGLNYYPEFTIIFSLKGKNASSGQHLKVKEYLPTQPVPNDTTNQL